MLVPRIFYYEYFVFASVQSIRRPKRTERTVVCISITSSTGTAMMRAIIYAPQLFRQAAAFPKRDEQSVGTRLIADRPRVHKPHTKRGNRPCNAIDHVVYDNRDPISEILKGENSRATPSNLKQSSTTVVATNSSATGTIQQILASRTHENKFTLSGKATSTQSYTPCRPVCR
jgi:hypothetical protein